METGDVIGLLFWGGFILIGLLSWFLWDKRYRKNIPDTIPPGCIKTDEVFVDPVDGKRLRVYYNPRTGERFYRKE